jgi:predicted ABC-type ATPase
VKNPTLIVVCGPNGSGKTSITKKILKHEWLDNCTYINPDEIARDIFGDWNSPQAIVDAANYANKLRYNLLEQRESVIFETVFSSSEKLDYILKAKELGYFIRVFFVCTDSPTINASRIARRVIQGGHDVPIPKIISRYSKSIVNCAVISTYVDRLYVYDNSRENKEPKLLFRSSYGIIKKTYTNIHPWANEIFKELTKENKG